MFPETQPTPQPEIKPAHSPLTPLLSFFVVILLAISGFLGYQNMQLQKQIASIQSAPLPTPTQSVNPIANWRTYTNARLGYALQYPNAWQVEENTIYPIPSKPAATFIFEKQTEFAPGVYIWIQPQVEPKQWITEQLISPDFSQMKTQSVTIGGLPGTKISGVPGPLEQEWVFVTKSNQSIIFYASAQTDMSMFDQILSTFKFLEQTSTTDTSAWKAYQMEEFSFKYPATWKLDSNGRKITYVNPAVTLLAMSSNDPMYTECMKLDDIKTIGSLAVKSYSREISVEACNGGDPTELEKWIVKANSEGYQPGIQYIYSSTQKTEAEKIFEVILSSFRFTQ